MNKNSVDIANTIPDIFSILKACFNLIGLISILEVSMVLLFSSFVYLSLVWVTSYVSTFYGDLSL